MISKADVVVSSLANTEGADDDNLGFYKITEAELALAKPYWYHWFSQTKKNRTKKKYPKGFVQISFN